MKFTKPVGIISYGAVVPHFRIKVSDIAQVWGKAGADVERSLGVFEKTVPAVDEDTITLAVNAAEIAMSRVLPRPEIGAIYAGSESHPYAVKPTAVVVAEALGLGNAYTAADLEFACKAGTAAMQMIAGMVAGGSVQAGLAIGADTAQSKPGDALEFTAGAAGAAYVIGSKSAKIIARIDQTVSFSSDTPDFWRRGQQAYPSHAGRFTGEPAYFKHVISAVKMLMQETSTTIADFTHIVLHMPNARFPRTAAKMLGATDAQLSAGFVVPQLGNSYSACSLLGLASVLDVAEPGDTILVCSYGSGSGSDAFKLTVTDEIRNFDRRSKLAEQIADKEYISYTTYLINHKFFSQH